MDSMPVFNGKCVEVWEQGIPPGSPLKDKLTEISPLLGPYLHTLSEKGTAAVSLRLGLN